MGNGTSTPGMNQKLLPFLQAQKGKRFGIVCVYIYFPLGCYSTIFSAVLQSSTSMTQYLGS